MNLIFLNYIMTFLVSKASICGMPSLSVEPDPRVESAAQRALNHHRSGCGVSSKHRSSKSASEKPPSQRNTFG
jgi:hypothetical protein